MHLGTSLKIALAMKNLKNKELAEHLGVSSAQVSNWVSSGKMTLANLNRVCDALGMSVSEFVALGEIR